MRLFTRLALLTVFLILLPAVPAARAFCLPFLGTYALSVLAALVVAGGVLRGPRAELDGRRGGPAFGSSCRGIRGCRGRERSGPGAIGVSLSECVRACVFPKVLT
jgi:hypothetical protein